MEIKEARLRVMAKKFRDSIAAGTCLPLPDEIIDKIPDRDISLFRKCCYDVGLAQIKHPYHLYGYWERTHHPDPNYHFTLEEVLR